MSKRRKGFWYHEHRIHPAFKAFAVNRLLPLLQLDGYKIREKQRVALNCLHNLAMARIRGSMVMDSRDNSTNSLRVAVWDAIADAGLCITITGSNLSGRTTRYRPTPKLTCLLTSYERGQYIDMRLDYNTSRKRPTRDAYITLHTGKTDLKTGRPLPKDQQKLLVSFAKLHPDILPLLMQREKRLAEMNTINARHVWWLPDSDGGTGIEPNFALRETHSGEVNRFVRLVGWSAISIQKLSKEDRAGMRIDDEPVTELDFREYDVRRHYHYGGLDPDGDAYKPAEVFPQWWAGCRHKAKRRAVRKFTKKCTNILLNAGTQVAANRAIAQAFRKQTPRMKRLLMRDVFTAEQMELRDVSDRIIAVHGDIARVFFNPTYPPTMMSLGAQIMFEIRWAFAQAGKPCYCIHDGIVCRQSDRKYAKSTIIAVYQKWVRQDFRPRIRVEF